MKGLFVAAASLLAVGTQARLPDLREYLNDDLSLTSQAQKLANSGPIKRDSTPMSVQTAPLPYKIQTNKAQFYTELGSKRETMSYGPFSVQGMDSDNGMHDELLLGAPMPCTDCTVTWAAASLVYPNGTYANANTSLWLHHTVFINIAHPDTVCGSNYYGKGQRWFASGNERTIADYTIEGTVPAGYYIGPTDFQVIEIELMNQQMTAQDAVMEVEMEWIPGKPAGFTDVKPIWLDIAGCDIPSDMPVLSNTTFSYRTNTSFAPDFHGAIVGMGAHLHDGGVNLEVLNNNKTQCDSMAYYGGPGFIGPMMSGDGEMEHISFMSSCYAPYVGMVQPGDEWDAQAFYNFTQHEGMTNTDGSLSDIMGISIIYVAENMTSADMAKYRGKEQLNPNPPQPASDYSLMSGPTALPAGTGMPGMGGMTGMSAMPTSTAVENPLAALVGAMETMFGDLMPKMPAASTAAPSMTGMSMAAMATA